MNIKLNTKYSFNLIIVIALSLVLVACKHTIDYETLEKNKSNLRFEQILREAKKSRGIDALNLQILAADTARKQKYPARAQEILNELNFEQLPKTQKIYFSMVEADLALERKQPQIALKALSRPVIKQISSMPINAQVRAHLSKAQAWQKTGNAMAAIKERVFVGSLLNDEQLFANNNQIWDLLTSLPTVKLRYTGDNVLDAWQDLASSYKDATTVKEQQIILNNWRKKYPNHPANKSLPLALAKLPVFENVRVKKIALVLPQSGKAANVANSLKQGFIAAQNAAINNGGEQVEVEFYDSAELDEGITAFYKRLETDGVQVVVGPLAKNKVDLLAKKIILPINTLALNYAGNTDGKTPANLYQFGLAVEDEVREVVLKARAEGYKRAIAIVPKSDLGDRMLNEFKSQWRDEGGLFLAHEQFDTPANLSSQIAHLLRIKRSEQRIANLAKVLGRKSFEARPTRRQDVDFIFIVATPKQAQQIKPTLNYHYAADLPVYATSLVYSGEFNEAQYNDMQDIMFCDAPSILKTSTELRQRVEPYWLDANGATARIYSMGADAYHLALSLEQIQEAKHFQFEGLSGTLQLDKSGRITRRLTWAQFTGLQIRLMEESAN